MHSTDLAKHCYFIFVIQRKCNLYSTTKELIRLNYIVLKDKNLQLFLNLTEHVFFRH